MRLQVQYVRCVCVCVCVCSPPDFLCVVLALSLEQIWPRLLIRSADLRCKPTLGEASRQQIKHLEFFETQHHWATRLLRVC